MFKTMHDIFINQGATDEYLKWIRSLSKFNLILYGSYLDSFTDQADIWGHLLRYAT